ncbi:MULTISPECIES: sensor histidine kinase [Sphingobacterium]|uniref:histidine kinase n=2 Tax=Sphingobacterium TaxID=28453 RepID=A0ABX7CM14_SPHMU|nr:MULTISPECIES: ATP-binding protein [Sphingobacterium]QQT32297.1 HAMP domain-containing protein [Sphingobacterium multivorum]QQT51786.1 HAMP domain-containing protein [Sphingobacterium multivorum]RKF35140.1 PAS domain-containing sensor histidine kinase [Sphingobacterium siyangense]
MKLKAKLTFGVGFLFFMILLLAIVSGYYVYRLKKDTNNILVDNYNTLHYSRNMLLALEDLHTNEKSIALFEHNLSLQKRNVTEPGERVVTERIDQHFLSLAKQLKDSTIAADLHKDIFQLMYLNMQAIENKNNIANATAEKAILAISIVGAICFMIAFVLLVNLPLAIAGPIVQLTDSIKQIAAGNYKRRLHFKRKDEFGEVAQSFNTMAQKLEEYTESKLGKILQHKKRIEALIDNMHDAVIGIDEEKRVLFANEPACLLSGLKHAEFEGQKLVEIASSNDLIRKLLDRINALNQQSEHLGLVQIFAYGKDNYFELEVIDINVVPTGEESSQFIGQFILLKNVTSFKERDVAKTNFIGTVSHELKTPIASIRMGIQLLENKRIGELNEEQKDLLEGIADDTERLLKITGELLDIAQVESGTIQMKLNPATIGPIIDYALLANRSMLDQKKIQLRVELEEELPMVFIDNEKTAWVLTNLLSNAIRYSDEGGAICLAVKRMGARVLLRVEDQGQGIPVQYLAKIFDRYFRVPGGTKEGTGLGLSISKEFIESMGGEIDVQSVFGTGSAFFVYLPIAPLKQFN